MVMFNLIEIEKKIPELLKTMQIDGFVTNFGHFWYLFFYFDQIEHDRRIEQGLYLSVQYFIMNAQYFFLSKN